MNGRLPVHEPQRELRDHLTIEEWRRVILRIAERHELAASELKPFDSGSDVVWGTRREVIKLTAPKWSSQIANEVRWCRRLAGELSFRVPAVESAGELDGWPYVVLSRLPGRALGAVWGEFGPRARRAAARALGRAVAELHAFQVAGEPEAWESFFATCSEDLPDRHAEAGVPAELLGEIPELFRKVGELTGPHVVLHTEVLDQHVLVEPGGESIEVVGLIDFADARVGPFEYEFAAPVEFVFRGEAGLLREFMAGYGAADPPGEEARMRRLAWALAHRFGRLRRQLDVIGSPLPSSLAELAERLYA